MRVLDHKADVSVAPRNYRVGLQVVPHGVKLPQKQCCTNLAENEIEIFSRVQHPQLVNLLGFYVDPKNDKLLVVEYIPNGSLYVLLHSSSRSTSGWSWRIRFAVQIQKAIQEFHSSNLPVIHQDIKSSALIDENWNARLGDFGLALSGLVEAV
ncbi:serine/threonine-protein kinase-like protein At3g51990 [Carya illinoinensis]|uniref:serine/threonine-protein kinase-like protein At3g51990 n=1 Tax=Carya illinoinensis TaxID=32201 RepID=UPI001C71C26B|nr:serine/threonine-protein kinase-like protein At3g51990 [Carya illinoinensis]